MCPKIVSVVLINTHDSFLEDLNSVPWSLCDAFNDPDDALCCWQTIFLAVADNHAPVTEHRVKNVKQQD